MVSFWYREFDVKHLMPDGWMQQVNEVVETHSKAKTLVASSVTSRELSNNTQIPVVTVGGRVVKEHLPWLYSLYLNEFREIAQSLTSEQVQIAQDDRYAVNLNVQRGKDMRYECHVDSNPIEGLLYLTDHPPGSGGELVVSHTEDARGTIAISEHATRIYPVSGKLVFFDARLHPHFVAPLRLPEDRRIVAAMNYYLPSCPETARPSDLNRHLGLE